MREPLIASTIGEDISKVAWANFSFIFSEKPKLEVNDYVPSACNRKKPTALGGFAGKAFSPIMWQ